MLVLEFKETEKLLRAYVDQVDAYARDLRHYHAATHDKLVDSVLVLTRGTDEQSEGWGSHPDERRRSYRV